VCDVKDLRRKGESRDAGREAWDGVRGIRRLKDQPVFESQVV
jgi:hypothetical protein